MAGEEDGSAPSTSTHESAAGGIFPEDIDNSLEDASPRPQSFDVTSIDPFNVSVSETDTGEYESMQEDPFFNRPSRNTAPASPSQPAPKADVLPSDTVTPSASRKHAPEILNQNSMAMKIGTLFVIGGIAANVFGFRYSRWAVGKDIHRAWERQQQANRTYTRTQSSHRQQQQQKARYQEEQKRRHTQNRREAHERARAEDDKRAREEAREMFEQWERMFRPGGMQGGFRSGGFRVEFDARVFERFMRGGRGGGGGFGMSNEMFEELMREMRQEEKKGRRAEDDFDAFKFWEQMAGAEWRNFERGPSGGGVHQRVGMGRHYAALGLKENASDSDVKSGYRKAVMKWHPDRYRGNDSEHAARKFREATEAYDALTRK